MMTEPRAGRSLPADNLHAIVGHHLWATLRLIDRCMELAPEQLELSTPGTFGSIHATLDHMVRADGSFLHWIVEGQVGGSPQQPLAPVATLRADMERHAEGWRQLLSRVDELRAPTEAEEGGEPYPGFASNLGVFLTQALHHGAEHRSHVCSVLGAHGLEVPDLSGWGFAQLGAGAASDRDRE